MDTSDAMFTRVKTLLKDTLQLVDFEPEFLLKVTWKNMLPSYQGLDTEVSGLFFLTLVGHFLCALL